MEYVFISIPLYRKDRRLGQPPAYKSQVYLTLLPTPHLLQ